MINPFRRSLRWALLVPVLIVTLMFALLLGLGLNQRLQQQAYYDGISSAQSRVEVIYALLRSRFEYHLLSSQGNAERYAHLKDVVQEEAVLLLKNVMTDWAGKVVVHSDDRDEGWVWTGREWLFYESGSHFLANEWAVHKAFLPWNWTICVRPDVEHIEQELAYSQRWLFVLVLGLWLLMAGLVWWRLQRVVLTPLAQVNQYLTQLNPQSQAHIQLDGNQDMALLASHLNHLSERLYTQHLQLEASMVTLTEDRAYLRSVLDAQPAITILTNGEEMVDANEALFRFFSLYPDLETFRQSHKCICDLFVPYQDPLGYAYLTTNHPHWVELVLRDDYRVQINNGHQHRHFIVRARRFDYYNMHHFIIVFDDITSYVQAELSMRQQLVVDALTQLPNRVKLIHDMSIRPPQGVLLVKLLEFGRLNEVYGIDFSDRYLKAFADRLREECRAMHGLIGPYRLSGSEFAYQLLDDTADSAVWRERAKWLLTDLNHRDLTVMGADIPVMVAGGFSLRLDANDDAEPLLLQAAMAINRARREHLLQVLEYDEAWRERQRHQQSQEWLENIRMALLEDRIEPVFQPIYNQHTASIDKYECLMRCRTKHGDLVAPGLFLEAVKHTREYLRLTQVMFEKSSAFFADRTEQFSLNLSEDDFHHKEHIEALLTIIQRHRVGDRLTLEVLESDEITSYQQMLDALAPFRALGCHVAIDDFGSGYANFAHISGLKPEILKIDGSLVQAMLTSVDAEEVVQGLIDFGHRMHLSVIAEFVSSPVLWQKLASMGVDGIQGYAVSPPLLARELV